MERLQLEEKVVTLIISGIKCVLQQHLEEELSSHVNMTVWNSQLEN